MRKRKIRLSKGEKILWQGRQWVITTRGMEPLDHRYWIEKGRLAETRPFSEGTLGDWLLHMAEKNWVDIEDFIRAWQVACKLHHTDLGRIDVTQSIKEARTLHQSMQAYEARHAGQCLYLVGRL
jgi:hypothetical protein